MKTETQLVKEIAAARAAYLNIVDSGNRAEVTAASAVVTALQAELQATLATGAEPCPRLLADAGPDGQIAVRDAGIPFTIVGATPELVPIISADPNDVENKTGWRVCGCTPIGMQKTPDILDKDGHLKAGAVYEVGCPLCPVRARGSSPEKAVALWNEGTHIGARPADAPIAVVV